MARSRVLWPAGATLRDPQEPEAELLCSLLRSAEIECALRQTNVGAGAADGMPGGPYELVVRPQDLDDARDILRERSDTGEQ
jgi:hypothetical protein